MRRLLAGLVLVAAIAAGCGGGGGGSAASFCDDARTLEEKFNSLEGGDFSATSFEDILTELKKLSPPSEIEDDYNIVLDAFQDLVDALDGRDITDPALQDDPDFLAAGEKFQSAEVTAASDNVTKYLEDECGIVDEGS